MNAPDPPAARAIADEVASVMGSAFRFCGALSKSETNLTAGADVFIDVCRELQRARRIAIESNFDFADDIDSALSIAVPLAGVLRGGRERERAIYLSRQLASRLERCREMASRLAVEFKEGASTEPAPCAEGFARPSLRAIQLIHVAVWLLPHIHQARFREEFHAELYDLTASGSGRWSQLRHALRVLTRTVAHRRALQAPKPDRERTL